MNEDRLDRSSLLWILGANVVLLAVYFPLFLPLVPTARDLLFYFFPLKHHLAEALSQGEVPWIDRYRWGGTPLLSSPGTAAFYPLNILFLLLPLATAMKAWILLHLSIGLWGASRLSRAFGLSGPACGAAGLLWSLSGATISLTVFTGASSAMAWIPWAAWISVRLAREPSRRDQALLALFLGLVFLTAVPEWALYAVVFSAALFLDSCLWNRQEGAEPGASFWRSRLGAFLPGLLLSVLLAAPVVFISAKTAADSVRGPGGGTNLTFASQQALPRARWAELFGDRLVADWATEGATPEIPDYPYLPSLTPGLAGWLLAITGLAFGRKRAILPAWLGVAGFLLAIGPATPVFTAVYRMLPPLQSVRYPEKHFVITAAALAWLGILGLGIVEKRLSGRLSSLVIAGACLLLALEKGPMARDLLSLEPERVLEVVPPNLKAVPTARGDELRPRIYHMDSHAPVAAFNASDLPTASFWGRASVQPAFASLFGRGYIFELDYDLSLPASTLAWTRLLEKASREDAASALKIVRHVGASTYLASSVTPDGRWAPVISPVPGAVAPFRFARRVERNPDSMRLFQTFLSQGADPATAYVEGGPAGSMEIAEGKVLHISDRADGLRIEVEVPGTEPAFLMLFRLLPAMEEAAIDGQELSLQPMGFGFGGAWIPPGRHVLVFRPMTRWVKSGIMVSGAALFIVGYLFWTGRRRTTPDSGAVVESC